MNSDHAHSDQSSSGRDGPGSGRVRIPADVDRDDPLLAGLAAGQLAILAVAGLLLYAGYASTRALLPLPVFAALAAPLALLAGVLAVGRRDGLAADRLAVAAWRMRRAPRRLVPAPGGIPAPLQLLGPVGVLPAPLRLPVTAIGADGLLDLGPDGAARLARASSLTFALRTPAEQQALLGAFGRWLNALGQPVQILARTTPADLSAEVAALHSAAGALPHPALEAAARAHATFLAGLAAGALRRELLVVFRDPQPAGAPERLARQAQDATDALAAAGVALTVLSGPAATAVLAAVTDPDRPRPAAAGPSGLAALLADGATVVGTAP